MKNNCTSFCKTKLASNPINMVTVHNMLPKRDEWSDFEYSFFFANFASNNWVKAKTPKTNGNLYQNSPKSNSPKYPRCIVKTVTVATISDTTNEK